MIKDVITFLMVESSNNCATDDIPNADGAVFGCRYHT